RMVRRRWLWWGMRLPPRVDLRQQLLFPRVMHSRQSVLPELLRRRQSVSNSFRKVSIMERLDELSKLLAASVSRRESLRRIAVVLAGSALNTLGINTAWAARPDRCSAFCRWCPTRTKRNQCLEACRACNGNTSRLCGSCGAYVCCPTGAACCNGTCTDLNSNSNNCGACGNVCPASVPVCNQVPC